MSRIVVIAHHGRADAWALASTTIKWLRDRGHLAWIPADEAAMCGLEDLAGEGAVAEADVLIRR